MRYGTLQRSSCVGKVWSAVPHTCLAPHDTGTDTRSHDATPHLSSFMTPSLRLYSPAGDRCSPVGSGNRTSCSSWCKRAICSDVNSLGSAWMRKEVWKLSNHCSQALTVLSLTTSSLQPHLYRSQGQPCMCCKHPAGPPVSFHAPPASPLSPVPESQSLFSHSCSTHSPVPGSIPPCDSRQILWARSRDTQSKSLWSIVNSLRCSVAATMRRRVSRSTAAGWCCGGGRWRGWVGER